MRDIALKWSSRHRSRRQEEAHSLALNGSASRSRCPMHKIRSGMTLPAPLGPPAGCPCAGATVGVSPRSPAFARFCIFPASKAAVGAVHTWTHNGHRPASYIAVAKWVSASIKARLNRYDASSGAWLGHETARIHRFGRQCCGGLAGRRERSTIRPNAARRFTLRRSRG